MRTSEEDITDRLVKLANVPIPMTATRIDEYMGPIVQSAQSGDLQVIRNV